MVMDTTSSTGRWLSAERATKMFDRLSNLGATYVELRAMSCDSNVVRLRDGSMDAAVPAQELGVTLRVLADGAWGVHSTTDLDSVYAQGEETLRVARAVAARRPAGEPQVELAEVPVITDEVVWAPKGDVRDLDLDARLDAMKAVEAEGKDDERIASVVTGWSDEHLRTEVLTSEGMDRAWSLQRALLHCTVTAREGDRVAAYRTRHGGEGGANPILTADLGALGRRGKEAALRQLTAAAAPSGKLPLIADPDLTGVYIHEALGHPCEADLVAAGDSCLEGRLGQKIGSDIVTVVDDPTLRGGYGAYPVDDEGVDAREKMLIRNGVLTEYLNHRETAGRFDLEPNAGARAQDGLHHPLVRMSNTVIQGGSHRDLDALVDDVEYGVFACGTRGGQVDTGRGSFQFAAQEAWLIEGGELTQPLRDVSVSGMTLEILNDVDGLAKEGGLASPGFCGKGQTVPVGDGGPYMRISTALVG
ncbi:MAG: TldD/PmbA family protein [Candidatus Poseidoniaceae archaeon]